MPAAESARCSPKALGDATVADRIEVRWPTGGVDVVNAVAADRIVTIRERAK